MAFTSTELSLKAEDYLRVKVQETYPEPSARQKFVTWFLKKTTLPAYCRSMEHTFWDLPKDPLHIYRPLNTKFNDHLEHEWKKLVAEYTEQILLGETK